MEVLGPRAEEVEDRELLDIPVSIADVLLTRPDLAGRSIDGRFQGGLGTQRLSPQPLRAGGQDIPLAPGITVERGDILRLVGPEAVVSRAAKRIGVVVAPTTATDFFVLGLAIFLGGLVGVLVTIPIGDMRISLSTSVGTLLAGLVVGHLRTRFPLFGRIPDAAVSLMTALGLAAFVAMTGLHAGPVFVSAIAEAGIGLLFGGMVVTADAHDCRALRRTLPAPHEPYTAPRWPGRGADHDGRHGGRAGPVGEPGCRPRLSRRRCQSATSCSRPGER